MKASFHQKYFDDYFNEGNGDKCAKRLIRILTDQNKRINVRLFDRIIRTQSKLRLAALKNVSNCGFDDRYLHNILHNLQANLLHDDAHIVYITRSIVDSVLKYSSETNDILKSIFKSISGSEFSRCYCSILFLARFGTKDTILSFADQYAEAWTNDPFLSRSFASLSPRMNTNQHRSELSKMMTKAHSSSYEIISFFDKLNNSKNNCNKILPILSTMNKLPLGYSIGKYITSEVYLSSPIPSESQKRKVLAARAFIDNDEAYSRGGIV